MSSSQHSQQTENDNATSTTNDCCDALKKWCASQPSQSPSDSDNKSTNIIKDDDSGGEILILSDYPFYVKGAPPAQLAKVAEQCKQHLREACGSQLVAVDRMGSSAIDGIAGTPVCDILAQISPWPLSPEAKTRLQKLGGYECKGAAPHNPQQDEWFFGGHGKPGHLGRVVLHTVPAGCEFVAEMQAFVAYVKSHRDAFERYNKVKIDGAREMLTSDKQDGRLLGYKMKKDSVCRQIKQEAIEWWEKGKQKEQKQQSKSESEASNNNNKKPMSNGNKKRKIDDNEKKANKEQEENNSNTPEVKRKLD